MAVRAFHTLPSFLESGARTLGLTGLLIGWLLVFSPLLDGGTTHQAVLVIRLTILLLLAWCLVQGLRAGTIDWPSIPLGLPVAAYLALAVLSTIRSPYTHQSLQWLIVLLGYALLLYLLVSHLRTWNHAVQLLGLLLAMALVQSGLALLQHHGFKASRPTGTFFNPNFLAGYLVAAWAIVLGWMCHHPLVTRGAGAGQNTGPAARFGSARAWCLAAIGLALFLAAIMETASRGGLLALLVATGFVAAVRFGLKGLAALCLALLTVAMLSTPLRERMAAEHAINPVTYARLDIWRISLHAMWDHPLGIGLGLYQYVYPRYAFPVEGQIARYGKVAQTSHSEYLQMGIELGWLSLMVFAWGVFLVGREVRRVLRADLHWWQRGLVVGVAAALVGILAHAAVDANLHEPALAIVLTLAVALLLSVQRMGLDDGSPVQTIPLRSPAWGWAGLALVAGAAWLVLRMGLAWTSYEAGSRALEQGDVPAAVDAYQQALQRDAGAALYHSALAAAYFREFERTGGVPAAQVAAGEIRKAMDLNPLDGRLPGLLGRVYGALALRAPASPQAAEWRRAALAAYESAAGLEPYAPFYRLELARLHLELGEREKAETAVRTAVEMEPNFLPGREWLARFYLHNGQRGAAEAEYREIQERLQRYAHWAKDPVEARFLKVDAAALAVSFAERKSPT